MISIGLGIKLTKIKKAKIQNGLICNYTIYSDGVNQPIKIPFEEKT